MVAKAPVADLHFDAYSAPQMAQTNRKSGFFGTLERNNMPSPT